LSPAHETTRSQTGLAIAIVTYQSIVPLRSYFPGLAEVAGELGTPLVAVDNASTDGSAEFLGEWTGRVDLTVQRNPVNRGYAAAVNLAFAAVPGRDVLLLNPDVAVTDAADIERLWAFLDEQPRAAAVAPRLLEPDGSVQSSARRYPTIPAMAGHSTGIRRFELGRRAARRYLEVPEGPEPTRVDWVIGAAMLIRREAFDELGGWDEGYFLYLEDTDFCLRAERSGWETWYLPSVRMRHLHPRASDPSHGSAYRSAARRHHFRSAVRFFRRYPGLAFRSA
jgi:GT2 family glycosyltransferase